MRRTSSGWPDPRAGFGASWTRPLAPVSYPSLRGCRTYPAVGGGCETVDVTSWQQFETEAGELATAVRGRFEATKHHVLATLRRDGSPRVSGTEVDFQGPDLVLGSMLDAVKARDLQRDGRFALHANPGDGSMAGGDAKVSGRAVEVVHAERRSSDLGDTPPAESFHLFRLTLAEVILTSIGPDGDRLLIQWWRPGAPLRSTQRR